VTVTWAAEPRASAAAVWLGWDDYLKWLDGRLRKVTTAWGETVKLGPPAKPGDHEAYIGPTGEGKSTHAVGRLSLRRFVLALDAKGEDQTLAESGYVRVNSIYQDSWRWKLAHREDARTWEDIWRAIDDGRPARVIVGGPADDDDQFARLKALMLEAVSFCRFTKGWTLYCDEFEVLSSQEMFNLRAAVNHALITARARGISVLTCYQAQAWVSKHAIRQSQRATVWRTGDRQLIKNIAEGMGRDWHEVAEGIDQLPQWHTLTIPRGPNSGPMIITHAPKLGPAKTPPQQQRRAGQGSRSGGRGSPAASHG
jgi:hypothetical protein